MVVLVTLHTQERKAQQYGNPHKPNGLAAVTGNQSVTPDVNNSAVLIVGSQNGPMVVKGSTIPAGDAVAPTARLGQTALNSGHKRALSKLPNAGTECALAHHNAVKNAPKNITSEKMNQVMLQR